VSNVIEFPAQPEPESEDAIDVVLIEDSDDQSE
jgi:hypothetical protein